MSATVGDVHAALLATCSTVLGAGWQQLKKVFDPAQNDLRNIEQGYGVRHGAASPLENITVVYSMGQQFDIVLTDRAANRDSDLAIQERLNVLYDKADQIFKEALRTRLSLDIVTLVSGLRFEKPELLTNGAILLTASLDVTYYIDSNP
ncbi:MAG: hypothetical protein IPO08_20875 [Xanthomonadales bacterium]|nr:hypothetical protein [Xanthomonadales bacterium]